MFIAYLEDRGIITPEYFRALTGNGIDSFSLLLATGKVELLESLFASLRDDFNGDLFVAPCSFESLSKVIYQDKDVAIWHDINLCKVSKVTLHWDKKSGDTTAVTE